jgi:hypothetical protein
MLPLYNAARWICYCLPSRNHKRVTRDLSYFFILSIHNATNLIIRLISYVFVHHLTGCGDVESIGNGNIELADTGDEAYVVCNIGYIVENPVLKCLIVDIFSKAECVYTGIVQKYFIYFFCHESHWYNIFTRNIERYI